MPPGLVGEERRRSSIHSIHSGRAAAASASDAAGAGAGDRVKLLHLILRQRQRQHRTSSGDQHKPLRSVRHHRVHSFAIIRPVNGRMHTWSMHSLPSRFLLVAVGFCARTYYNKSAKLVPAWLCHQTRRASVMADVMSERRVRPPSVSQ